MSNKKQKRLLLLDGNAIIHRAFHALPPLKTREGLQVNAVYGFASTFLNVLEKFQPDYIITTFDLPKKTFRHEKFSDYKANRKKTDEDLIPQFNLVKNLVKSFNITILEKEGFEADDLIGTISVLASQKKLETIIVTGDKDTLQLVDDNVKVFTMSRGIKDMLLYDREIVKEKTGLFPEQIVDFKGLRGDSSDNIPGVKGIGEKTALNLLTEFGSLEKVYSKLDFLKQSVKIKLEENKEIAYLSKELGTIHKNVPITFNWEETKSKKISFAEARKFFQKFNFKSLLKRLPQDLDLELGENKSKINKEIVVLNLNNFDEFYNLFLTNLVFFHLDFENDIFYGTGFSIDKKNFYLSFNHENISIFNKIFNDKKVKKIGFDTKKSLHILAKKEIYFKGLENDLLLEVYLCRAGEKIDLNNLIFEFTGRIIESLNKNNQMTLSLRDDILAQELTCLKTNDIKIIHNIFKRKINSFSEKQVKNKTVLDLLKNIEIPLIKILFKMEENGIAFDKNIFKEISSEFNFKLNNLESEIYKLAEEKFNINSTQQLRAILFDKLKIDSKDINKTKTGFSTASSELEKIRDKHPIISKIEDYRELFKLKTTYVDSLPKLVDKNSRIHTTFNQAVTATGRLSSSDPNLQNIPIRTETGRQLRKAFVSENNFTLLSLDYSQIDLRCIAHISQDEHLIQAFKDNLDIHSFTASKVWGKSIESVSKEERRAAKELNFGLIYGMGIFGFSRSAGISVKEAKIFIENYFEKFPKIKDYIEKTKEQVRKTGVVETILGRRRDIPEINSKNFQLKSMGERMAINMPVQGLTADIMKLAMISIDKYLRENYLENDVKIILQIHDEIIFEIKDFLIEKISLELKKIMENAFELSVPLVVNIKKGKSWNEL